MISYQWTSAITALAIAGTILLLVRKDLLHTRFSYWWFVIAGLITIAGLFPRLIDRLVIKLGVHYPPILIIAAGMGLMLIKMLTMDLDRSKQEWKIRRLIQRLAMLEAERSMEPSKDTPDHRSGKNVD